MKEWSRGENNAFSRLGTLIPYVSPEQFDYLSTELTPSESEPCHCFSCFKRKKKERKKYTVRRMPGKIAHLVPMQRFDSIIVRRAISMTKPSNSDYHSNTSTTNKSPPMMITTAATIAGKSSMNEATFVDGPSSFTSPRSLLKSTSINSLKMPHEQPIRVNSTDPENLLSQTRLQTMLSRFRQDVEPTPIRLDMKRSSV